MNVRTGDIVSCIAKAVIITAGGVARFGLPDNGYLYGVFDCPANTGDAYGLAYRSGASLTGMEHTTCAYVVKDINAPLLYITLTRGAKLLNAIETRLDQDHPSTLRMLEEHAKGLGPCRISLQHLPEERIKGVEQILFGTEKPVLQRFFKERDIDFRHSDIETYPTEYSLCGGHGISGIEVNEKAQSSLPGLYAAGDSANVARGHLTGAFTFGEIAAEQATEAALKRSFTNNTGMARENTVKQVMDKIKTWQDQAGSVTIEEFEFKVRRIINNYVVPPKNEYKLDRALQEMAKYQQRLAEDVKVETIHDLVKCFEVQNIMTCATLSAAAAKERKESRWGFYHYRSDYPNKDEKYADKHVVVKKGSTESNVIVYTRPVEKISTGMHS